ncbi:16510_t:CDS:2, partial [Cetraspora pellucida]
KINPLYSAYLDKNVLLLIGCHTVQVWHDQDEKKTLEFISVIDKSKHRGDDRTNIKKVEYGIRKFKLEVQSKDSGSIESIEMEADDDYLVYAVKEACESLKFLYQIYKESEYAISLSNEDQHIKFKEIVEQTRNIIIRFIQLYPIVWRLLDIRFGLLNLLIEAREYQLIKYILFNEEKDIDNDDDLEKKRLFKMLDDIVSKLENLSQDIEGIMEDITPDQERLLHEKSLHMPQYKSWEGEDNVIGKSLSDDDPVFLGYFLEYYSNKAVKEIGWMITVSEIIPKMYAYNKEDKNYEFYRSYIRLLFFKRCFCEKELDIPFFEFLEIPPSIDGALEVFIPVTQFIPQDSNLKINMLSGVKIPDIQMVPLIYFATNKLLQEKRENKYMSFLKSIFYPGNYVPLEECHIPFLHVINKVEDNLNDPFYCNPSMEAIINFMWDSSKSRWHQISFNFLMHFLSYSIISWMFIAHIEVTGEFQHILVFIFLGYASYIGLSQSLTTYEVSNDSEVAYIMTGKEPENSFSNLFNAIFAAYNWDSIALDTWGFWPLIIINVIGSIVIVLILQNIIISFMSVALEDADNFGKRAVLNFQCKLIYYHAVLKNSALASGYNDFHSKFKDKLEVKYICFYNDQSITNAWRDESKKWETFPIYLNAEKQMQTEEESEFFIKKDDLKFIWWTST